MGLIIKNGIKYFGDNTVQLTQAQYDALSQAEKLNGTTYYITDGQNITTASAVSYNNTASGMTATDVQSAIDEVSNRSFTQTLLIDTGIATAQNVTIPNFSNYDFVQAIIKGDNNNGISVFVPTALAGVSIPFSLYSINSGETFSDNSYAIHTNGRIANGIVIFNYLKLNRWTECRILAYGIKRK